MLSKLVIAIDAEEQSLEIEFVEAYEDEPPMLRVTVEQNDEGENTYNKASVDLQIHELTEFVDGLNLFRNQLVVATSDFIGNV